MWHVDGSHNSLITAGNGGSNATHAAVTLFYNRGKSSYTIEKQLEPGEQIWADVGDIIRNQIPDKNGKTIPREVTMGSYELRDLDHIGVGYLYEGKLVIDKTWGHGYYGCAGCCGYEGQQMLPNPFSGGVGTQGNNTAESEDMCSNSWVDVTAETYDWATTNSDIVNLANAVSHFMSGGTVTGSGQVQLQRQLAREECPVEGFEPQNTQTAQVPTSLSIVSGTDSTSPEAKCSAGSVSGCGVTRTLVYQVLDQSGVPINSSMSFYDTITNVSGKNGCNLTGYTTTCSPQNSGPCGKSTGATGQFQDSLSICDSLCYSGSKCTTGCSTAATQTWYINGSQITMSLSYQCNKVLVNGN